MGKKEFLELLEESLSGQIPVYEIQNNLRYYEEYITTNHLEEQDILKNIGDPRLIARSIIDAYSNSKGNKYQRESVISEDVDNHSEDYSDTGYNKTKVYEFRNLKILSIIIGIIFLVILVGCLYIGGVVIKLAFRYAGPIIILLILYYMVKKR